MRKIPIAEFDPNKIALIEPGMMQPGKLNINPPEHCVMPIFGSIIEKLKRMVDWRKYMSFILLSSL